MPAMLPSRMLGTETLIDASGVPAESRSATATAATPSELSSQLSAYPCRRTWVSSRISSWRLVIEAGIGAGRSSPG